MSERCWYENDPELKKLGVTDFFARLAETFKPEFQIWIRIEDFERNITAGIINTNHPKQIAVTLVVKKSGYVRNKLSSAETVRALNHLRSSATDDLALQ